MNKPTEPTEEQMQAALDWISLDLDMKYGAKHIAQLLAEREAKLQARVYELEQKIKDAVFSCPGCGRHDFGFFAAKITAACGPCRVRWEKAEARVAELEKSLGSRIVSEGELGLLLEASERREAQHLAHIKALEKCIADHEEEEGVWIPRADFKDMPKPLTNAAQDQENE